MIQYAVLIYVADRVQGEDTKPEELQAHDDHAWELRDAGRVAATFALESAATERGFLTERLARAEPGSAR